MAQIPQINNPITAKNYNYSPRQQDETTEPFDIVKLTGVGAAGVNSDSASKSRLEMGNRELIPLQVLAYYISYHKGLDVDKPRNLAKSVTVE